MRLKGIGAALDAWRLDVRYAWRAVRKAPGLSAAVIATIALATGANSAVYSVANTLLLTPPPYRAPERLALLWANMDVAAVPRARLAGPEVIDFQENVRKIESLAAIQSASATITGSGDPEQVRVGQVTRNFFDVLGVAAARGRLFDQADESSSGSPAVVLSWPLFQVRFGADPSIVGRVITLNGTSVVVVGVLPPEFRLYFPADAGIPDDLQLFQPIPVDLARGNRLLRYYRVVARLADGTTMAQAAAEVEAIGASLAGRFPTYIQAKHTFYLTPLLSDTRREVRPALIALLGGVLVVLVAACVNVAGLVLARAAARRREIGTLIALGADRRRLVRRFIVEAFLIAGAGTVAGLATGVILLRAIIGLRPPGLDRIAAAGMDAPVLAGTVAVALIWGGVLTLVPLTEFRWLRAAPGLRSLSQASVPVRLRTRSTLVVLQVALGTVLAVAAGLLGRSLDALYRVDAGFDLHGRALTFRLTLPPTRYPTSAHVNTFARELETRLHALPAVRDVGAISQLPFEQANIASKYFTEFGDRNLALARAADTRYVSPGALAALGLRLVDGRWFNEDDDDGTGLVAVVDERLARLAWPGRRAVGQRIHLPFIINREVRTDWGTVVGVVRHARHRTPDAELQEQVYLPFRQNLRDPMAYVLRTDGVPVVSSAAVRQVVAGLDRSLAVYDVRPLASYVEAAVSSRKFTSVLIGSFAFLSVLLAGVGLAALFGYSVAARQREFGIRLALGASSAIVRRQVLAESCLLLGAGVVLGVGGAAAAARFMRSLLYGVGPADPFSYSAAVVLLGLTGLAATWNQARRASRVNPVEALRAE